MLYFAHMRTINDIIPPSRRREGEGPTSDFGDRVPSRPPLRRSRFPFPTLIAALVVIAAAVGALYYFSTAKVDVTPNTLSVAVQGSFTATESTGDFPYEIVTAQKIASQSVKSSGTKQVDTAASGLITVYNTQTKPQKLIANTRFATTAGLIFRVHEAITVPAGSAAKPGSVTVKAYADKTGDAYNVGPTSFTVPGFAGTPQASQVYARSTGAMTGGASGTVPVIDPALEGQAREALITALGPDLAKSLQSQIPSGYTLLPGASTTTYERLVSAPSSATGMVDVKEQGTVTAIVFPDAALAKAVVSSVSGLEYHNEPLSLLPTSSLQLSAAVLPQPNAESFQFSLSGTAALTYIIDATRIAAAVAGKTRSAAEVALTNYPEVKRAVIILRPFWRQSFPQDPSTILVTVANP